MKMVKRRMNKLLILCILALLFIFPISFVQALTCTKSCANEAGSIVATASKTWGCESCKTSCELLCDYINPGDLGSVFIQANACTPEKDQWGNCGTVTCQGVSGTYKNCATNQYCDLGACANCDTCETRNTVSPYSPICVADTGASCGTKTCNSYSKSGNSCTYSSSCPKTCTKDATCGDCTCATTTLTCTDSCTVLTGCISSDGKCTPKCAGGCYKGLCDFSPPTTIITPNGANWTNHDVPFTLTCTDYGGTGGTASGCNKTSYKIIDSTADCSKDTSKWNTTSVSGMTATISGLANCSGSLCIRKVCFNSTDNAGNSGAINISANFSITKIIPQRVDISHYPLSIMASQEINISSYASDSASGIQNITIYVDGNPYPACTKNPCNLSTTGLSAGNHSYYAVAYNNAGNFNQSIADYFTINENPGVTCFQNTQKAEAICAVGQHCAGGIFIDSSDAGNGTSALCCLGGTCSSQYVLPLCSGPPLNGIEYDPSLATCDVLIDAQPEDPSLKCCSGTPSMVNPNVFEVYWSRQTSGYFKLTEAGEGDNLYCIAKGVSGNVQFGIQKSALSTGNSTANNDGIAMFKVIADEVGKMSCTVNGNSTTITVTAAGKNENALPFFGLFQFIIALTAIIIYCRVNFRGKR